MVEALKEEELEAAWKVLEEEYQDSLIDMPPLEISPSDRQIAAQRDAAHMRAIGKKGGEATRSKLGREHFKLIGSRGGKAIPKEQRAARSRAISAALKLKYGEDYFVKLAAKSAVARRSRSKQDAV